MSIESNFSDFVKWMIALLYTTFNNFVIQVISMDNLEVFEIFVYCSYKKK